jgi:hypothetical protein
MNLFQRISSRVSRAFTGAKFANGGGNVAQAQRALSPMGPWSGIAGLFEPNTVNPWLYEALRRAIPPLDGGIGSYISLDGIVRVEGDNEPLVREIREWMETVPVNDAQKGLQAIYSGLGNEAYEQGFAVAEYFTDAKGRDIAGFRIADSKGVRFQRTAAGMQVFYLPQGKQPNHRGDGTEDAERIMRGTTRHQQITPHQLQGLGFVELDPERLIYTIHEPEADNPYGTSLLRSIEFVSQILLTIQNATAQSWTRFGDPPLSVLYKTSNPKVDRTELDRRKATIAANLAQVLDAKRKGNSVDFVNAVGKDDDITISIIGASDKVLEIEMPSRHMLEQILAKMRLPSWMLGFQWNTSDRASDGQVEMALGASKVRWESRRPYLHELTATLLRLRGRTWRPGDWQLVQETPNLRDVMKTAQADFLRAQTAFMLANAGVDVLGGVALPGADPMGGGQPKTLLTPEQLQAVMQRVENFGAKTADDLRAVVAGVLAEFKSAA